jgi:glutathione S-transferase
MAPHIALHEIGVAFEGRPLSLARGEQREPAFLAVNPEGKVPTLVIDARPLTEVAAILFYLARRFPEAGLLPTGDLVAETEAISWMSFIASTVHGAWRRGPEHTRAVFGIADRRLGPRPWALVEYSIADIHLFRLYWRYRRSAKAAASTFPHLSAHYERMMKRTAVQRTCEIEAAIGYELPGWFGPATQNR